MGTFIITVAVLSLCAWVFQYFWKAVLRFCYNLLLKSVDVVKKIITATKRAGKAVMYLYRRWRNGKVTRTPINEHITEEIIDDVEYLPSDLQEALKVHEEVIVNKGEISPEDF